MNTRKNNFETKKTFNISRDLQERMSRISYINWSELIRDFLEKKLPEFENIKNNTF